MFPLYWFPCFLFGLWYYRRSYGVDNERRGSDAWMGKWIATFASAFFLTFWAWPLLVVYLVGELQEKKKKEVEALRKESEARTRLWEQQEARRILSERKAG